MPKPALKKKARITSKGQITVPHEVRRAKLPISNRSCRDSKRS